MPAHSYEIYDISTSNWSTNKIFYEMGTVVQDYWQNVNEVNLDLFEICLRKFYHAVPS